MADPRVVAESTWRYDGEDYTFTRRHENGLGWRYGDGPCDWFQDFSFTDGSLVYVSGPTPPKVEPAPDWTRWLPKEPLPDTGPKEFKVGQIWAAHTPRNNWRTVRRITGPLGASERGSEDHPTDTLAGKGGAAWGQDSFGAEHAILVQDVGESHPRDPDILYGRAPAVPMALVGETWAWADGPEGPQGRVVGTAGRCGCKDSGHDWVTVEGVGLVNGRHCPVAIAKLCTRISPAPQQPAPKAAVPTVYVGVDDGYIYEVPAAYPAVVPEAETEPARAIYPVTPPAWPPPWRPGQPICGRLTPAGYPCEVRGEHPATGCRVLTEAPPRCENANCQTPYENVAQRWCQSVDRKGRATGAVLELSCEPCHLRDEAEWNTRTRESDPPPDTRPIYRPLDLGRWASDPRLVWRERSRR